MQGEFGEAGDDHAEADPRADNSRRGERPHSAQVRLSASVSGSGTALCSPRSFAATRAGKQPLPWLSAPLAPERTTGRRRKLSRGLVHRASCLASVSADFWTASSCTKSFSGTTYSPARAASPRRPLRGWRRTRSGTAFSTRLHGSRSPWAFILWRRTTDWRSAISGRAFLGWLLVGWGLFNLVEGVVDHHILTIHHVREGAKVTRPPGIWRSSRSAQCLLSEGGSSPAPTNAFQTDSDATIAAGEQPARARFVRSRPRVMRMSVQS